MLTSTISFGKEEDSLVIIKHLNNDIIIVCPNDNSVHSGFPLSEEERLTQCFYDSIFTTNNPIIFYEKKLNLKNELVAEGPIIKVYYKKLLFHKHRFEFHKQGIWKNYDYAKNEIVTVEHSCLCNKKILNDFSTQLKIEKIK